ncbi:MAG: zf-TFIIB domain-containing protein [Gammaproteobacteria bacterium]|nr:zf-TFIIB domain-containing protein [Gammaproteobacteria bacterium]
MQCPKCSAGMEVIDFHDIEIDRCKRCHGIWFDHLEKEQLQQLQGSGEIDIGDDETAAEYNELVFVECPRCFTMLDQVEQEDPYLKYEICPTCHGSFFDAGEFRDYVTNSGGTE